MKQYKTANKTVSKFTKQAYNTAMSRRDSPHERLVSLLDKAERIAKLSDRVASQTDKDAATDYIWGLYSETQSTMRAYSVSGIILKTKDGVRATLKPSKDFSSEDWNQRNTHDKSCYSDIDNVSAPPEQIAIMLRFSENYTTSKSTSRMTDNKLYSTVQHITPVMPLSAFVSKYSHPRDKITYSPVILPTVKPLVQCLYPKPYKAYQAPSLKPFMRESLRLRAIGYSHLLDSYY